MRTVSERRRAAPASLGYLAILWLGLAGTAAAGDLSATVRDAGNKLLADAVVLATPLDRPIPPLKPGREIVDQIDHEFVPYVKPVVVGSAVYFPNKDNVRHQVYSFSRAKKFELPLYAGTPAAPVVFDKTGVIVLGCNIHDWMIGFIYVADTPYFGKSGDDGMVRIANLPAGEYEVRVWHPRLADSEESTSRRISVGAGTAEESWQLRLKPEFRLRRAPIGGHRGYY